MRRFTLCCSLVPLAAVLPMTAPPGSDAEPAEAVIVNDEGGPVTITGSVTYSDPLFLLGVAEPLVILEDQAGFVDRDRGFVMSEASQVMGQITSDLFTSPFTYNVSLPIEPEASLRDVDHDGETDTGVMVYAVAYWTNTWGDPFLEQRDLYGGGWSTAYASTLIDPNPSAQGEVIGGRYLIYAPDDQQAFPSGFGADGLLFTDDDPVVSIPQGYSVVDLDAEPFTFDRSREITIDLIEGEAVALQDFSGLSYTEAFDAMIEMFRTTYAFTEYKQLDWDAIAAEFRPRFEQAETDGDVEAYLIALRDFTWAIPDGHVGGSSTEPRSAVRRGDRRWLRHGDPRARRRPHDHQLHPRRRPRGRSRHRAAGRDPRARRATDRRRRQRDDPVVVTVQHRALPRLQQLRYAIRFPVDTQVEVTFQNPGATEPETVTLTTVAERESFAFSSFLAGLTGTELPVEFEILDSGYGYASIYSFADNSLLAIQLWERMIQTLNDNGVPGLIIDMRSNGGGLGFLADQMAAYFFDESLPLGNTGFYDETLGEFFYDPALEGVFHPPAENLRYHGPIAVLVGPSCASACEFFSYDMTLQERATIVGQYPTAGLGGSIEVFLMPEGEAIQFTVGRAVDSDGEIHIEGVGVVPTVDVPVDEETLFSEGDPVRDAAEILLDKATAIAIEDGGAIAIGDTAAGVLVPRTRVQYTLAVAAGDVFTITLGEETGGLDTYLRLYDVDGDTARRERRRRVRGHRQLGAGRARGPRGHVARGRGRHVRGRRRG